MDLPQLTASLLARLTGVIWWQLALALLASLVVQALRAKAWTQVLQIDDPELPLSYPKIGAAYAAGAGANAFIPAHGGDFIKLFLAKRAVRGASYPTLAASILVLIAVDTILAALFVLWGEVSGRLPGPDSLVDQNGAVGRFAVAHPSLAIISIALLLASGAAIVRFTLRRLEHRGEDLKRGLRACLNLRLLTTVLPWQLAAWLMQLPCYWLFLSAFSIHPSLARAATVQAASGLAIALPIAGGSLASQALLVAAFSGQVSAARTIAFFVGMRFAVAVINIIVASLALLLTLHTLDLMAALSSARAGLKSKTTPLPLAVPVMVDEEAQA